MRTKTIQITAVVLAVLLICVPALSGKPAVSRRAAASVKAQKQTAAKTAGKDDKNTDQSEGSDAGQAGTVQDQTAVRTREESLLEMVEPEAYRTAGDIDVPEGTFVSILMREGSSEYAHDFREGVKKACEEANALMGYSGKQRIRATCNAPSKPNSISGQSAILDEELARYPDVIAASIVDASACEVQFDIAMDNGIYIVGYDASPGYRKVAAAVETDNRRAAAEEADRLASVTKKVKGKKRILIFSHDKTSKNLKARVRGFRKQMRSEHPKVTIAGCYHMTDLDQMRKQIASYYAKDDNPGNDLEADDVTEEDLIRYSIETHPRAGGIFAADEETAMTVLNVLGSLEDSSDIRMAACGSSRFLEPYLTGGSLDTYIEENAYGMGYATAIACLRIAAGKGNVDRVETGYRIFPEE